MAVKLGGGFNFPTSPKTEPYAIKRGVNYSGRAVKTAAEYWRGINRKRLATLLDGHFVKNRGLTTAQTRISFSPSMSVQLRMFHCSVNHKF
jgi:hypothetical protein